MILLRLFFEFAKIGLFTVGGGMASFPFLLELSERTGWYTQGQLVDMVAISESTPGPIGINMATFTGFVTAGVPGAVIATLGMIFPTLILVLVVAKFLQTFRNNRFVLGAMYGLRPASTGLIAAAGRSVVLLSLIAAAALEAHAWASVVDGKSAALAAVLLIVTNLVKPTKDLHPVIFIAASAVLGIAFGFAGA